MQTYRTGFTGYGINRDTSLGVLTEGLKEQGFKDQLVGTVVSYQDNNPYEKLSFDFGERALKTAITSKEGSRRANYPISIR